MNEVWKFPLPLHDAFTIPLPIFSKVLTVQMQGNNPVLWVLVNLDEKVIENRAFRLCGTGHPIDSYWDKYIGTFQDGGFVGHLFEMANE
jgi:hypothetical protein